MKDLGWIIGVIQGEHSYCVNGVTYTVGAKFEPPREGRSVRCAIERIISGDMIHLMDLAEDDKLSSEYVCSAAGEED
jgi:hypothetical protein